MSVSIRSCPNCKSLILSDTLQCPSCNQVLKEELAAVLPAELPAIQRASADSIPCPDCGEMVRKGLVRCWRCGGFLREDIANKYQKMQETPREVILSKVIDEAIPEAASEVLEGDSDDFELAPGLDFVSADAFAQFGSAEPAAPAPQPAPAPVAKTTAPKPSPTASGPRVVRSGTDPAPATETPASKPAASAAAPVAAEAPKTEPAPEPAAMATTETPAAPAAAPEPPKVESTGDPLLDIALQEQNEADRRRKERVKQKKSGPRTALPGYVLVFCPEGHQIQVEERYRGMTGRCPKCKSVFHVPAIDRQKQAEEARRAAEEKAKTSRYVHWSVDAHLHSLDPTKLKLKPGSLEKDFVEVDLGFEPDGVLIIAHGKQGQGLFKGEKNKKKKEELRAEVNEYLRVEKPLLDLPASGYRFYDKGQMSKMQVVQPAVYAHESIFAGVPVFGEGRIAVRMPVTDQDKNVTDILFVSFYLTEFREFSKRLAELFGVKDLGEMEGVPLTDSSTNFKCHYLDRPVVSLEVTPFHKVDPQIEIEVSGFKCQACGLVVSEDGRKKEKLGGPAGKSIAKAPCPKCKQKFGDNQLQRIKPKPEEEAAEGSMSETGGLKTKA